MSGTRQVKYISRLQSRKRLLLIFSIIFILFSAQTSEPEQETLLVAVRHLKPCVIEANGRFTGFDIELWEAIAKRLELKFNYKVVDQYEIFSDLIEGKADVAFSCRTITYEREERIDFSHHYMDSGLRILVLSKTRFSVVESVKSLFSPIVLTSLAYLALFTFVCSHIVWCIERGNPHINHKYLPGIFEAFWYIMETMTTVGYGDVVPRRWGGRIVALIIMVIGIGFFGWFIAQISSQVTVDRLRSDINSPEDLKGRVVGTVDFTTSVPTLNRLGATVVPVSKIEEAYNLLLEEKVEAVVFDSPALLYYERHEGRGKVKVVGPLFDIQYYGFMFPQGSRLRESVNRVLLQLRMDGTYATIYNKWFGIL